MRYLVLVLMLLVGCSKVPEDKIKKELTLGFIPSRSVHEIQITSRKLADYLSEKTGYTVNAITLSNYAGVAVAMKSKRVDLAFVGPLNYLVIDKHVDVEPLTSAVRYGMKGYRGIIITRSDSDIESLGDLRGRSFIFGDALSASANLYPKAAMLEVGINPELDIKSLTMSSQAAIVMSVLKGKADAGAVYEDARKNPEIAKYAIDIFDKTKIIYRTELIPADPQIVRSALNGEQKAVLKKALIEMSNDPEAKGWLKSLYGIDSLVEATKEEYAELAEVANIAQMDMFD